MSCWCLKITWLTLYRCWCHGYRSTFTTERSDCSGSNYAAIFKLDRVFEEFIWSERAIFCTRHMVNIFWNEIKLKRKMPFLLNRSLDHLWSIFSNVWIYISDTRLFGSRSYVTWVFYRRSEASAAESIRKVLKERTSGPKLASRNASMRDGNLELRKMLSGLGCYFIMRFTRDAMAVPRCTSISIIYCIHIFIYHQRPVIAGVLAWWNF